MANELRIADQAGLTYTCEVREIDGDIIGSAVSLTESGSSGRYYGDFPSGSAASDTEYDLIYIQDSTIEATERRYWNGSKLLGPEDLITATGFSTHNAASVADAVWDETAADHTTAGTFGAVVNAISTAAAVAQAVWQYTTRTLTSSANVTASSLSGSRIEITRGVTFTNQWTGLTIPATWSRAYFTIKSDPDSDTDSAAVVQIVVTNPADGDDGLIRLNGGATTASNGTLVVDQAGGSITATLSHDATDSLSHATNLSYDLKILITGGTSQLPLRDGYVDVVTTPTRAIT